MASVTVNEEVCKGCGLCAGACPKKIMNLSDRLNQKGYHPIQCTDIESCISCAFCAIICPDAVITIEKRDLAAIS